MCEGSSGCMEWYRMSTMGEEESKLTPNGMTLLKSWSAQQPRRSAMGQGKGQKGVVPSECAAQESVTARLKHVLRSDDDDGGSPARCAEPTATGQGVCGNCGDGWAPGFFATPTIYDVPGAD